MTVDGKIYMMPTYTVRTCCTTTGNCTRRRDQGAAEDLGRVNRQRQEVDRDGVWGLGCRPALPIHRSSTRVSSRSSGSWAASWRRRAERSSTPPRCGGPSSLRGSRACPQGDAGRGDHLRQGIHGNFRNEKLAIPWRGARSTCRAWRPWGRRWDRARACLQAGRSPYTWMEVFVSACRSARATPSRSRLGLPQAIRSEETFVARRRAPEGLADAQVGGQPSDLQVQPEFEFQAKYVVEAGRADPFIEEWEAWGTSCPGTFRRRSSGSARWRTS